METWDTEENIQKWIKIINHVRRNNVFSIKRIHFTLRTLDSIYFRFRHNYPLISKVITVIRANLLLMLFYDQKTGAY